MIHPPFLYYLFGLDDRLESYQSQYAEASIHPLNRCWGSDAYISQPMALAPNTAADEPSSPLIKNFALSLNIFSTCLS